MPLKVANEQNVLVDVNPRVFSGYWHSAVAWVYSGGAWRRTYDPTDQNLLVNSRFLNGTDYFTYADGTIIGTTPPGWSAYSNAGQVNGNAYAFYSNTTDEYSRRYTFKATNSRMFFQSRIYVKQGQIYNASAYVHSINSQVGRKSFDIFADNVSLANQNQYIEIIKQFPTVPELTNEMRVECVFKALRDCLIQFNIGVGVDYNDSGEIQVSAPQITKTTVQLDYQPTPKTANYNAVIMDNSWMTLNQSFSPLTGTNHIESSMIIGDTTDEILLIGNRTSLYSSGIGVDLVNNKLFVLADNQKVSEFNLSTPLIRNKVFGLGLWYDVSGGYIKNIRLHANGALIAKIDPIQPVTGQVNFVFGTDQYPCIDLTIEQFGMFLNEKNYIFNIEEGSGNTSAAMNNPLNVTFNNSFRWLGTLLPKITYQPEYEYIGDSGMVVTITTDGTDYDTIEWRNQYGSLGINTNDLIVTIDDNYDYTQTFYAVYKNRFGSVLTNTTKIIKSTVNLMVNEDGRAIVTEDSELITPE